MALPSMPAVATISSPNKNRKVPTVQVKEERPEDAEIIALAAKMVEANKVKMAQVAVGQAAGQVAGQAGRGTMLGYVNRPRSTTTAASPARPAQPAQEKPPFDLASQKGKFGWVQMGEEYIPYIFRGDDKYCAVKMVELKLLAKYLNHLNSDIYTCTCIRSYFITENEAKLLSEINIKHAEGRFGREAYTQRDLVVRLQDATEFYNFLDLCYTKLVNPLSSTKQRCGFIRINGESVVPYSVKETKQFVPLFYFEGETDTLKDKAVTLEGWDLAYLKFCCKVQGIRSELFESDTCVCISLDHIKNYFAGGTIFDEYWPPKIVESSLLLAQKNQQSRYVSWTKVPPSASPVGTTPTVIVSKESPRPTQVNGWPTGHSQAAAALSANQNRYYNSTVTTPSHRPPHQIMHTGHAAANQHINSSLTRYPSRLQQISSSYYTPTAINHSAASAASAVSLGTVHHRPAPQPPPLVRVTAPSAQLSPPVYSSTNVSMAQNSSLPMLGGSLMPPPAQYSHNNNNNAIAKYAPPPLIPVNGNAPCSRYYGSGSDVIDLSSPPQSPQRAILSNGLSKQLGSRVAGPSINDSRQKKLIQILDTPASKQVHPAHPYPYKMQKTMVNGKMIPCINAKPYIFNELLMTVSDLLEYFFPNVSVSKCSEILQEVLQVTLFSGNIQQKAILRDNHKIRSMNDEVPLIQVKDVITYMPQMTYVMGSVGHDEGSGAKRQRVS